MDQSNKQAASPHALPLKPQQPKTALETPEFRFTEVHHFVPPMQLLDSCSSSNIFLG